MNALVSSLVLSEGGCFRCALRFSGDVSIQSYLSAQAESHQNHCSLCLGILNPSKLLCAVLEKVNQSGYEHSDYKFQVTLPPIVYLRQEWIYGKCKLSGISLDRVIDIKDAFKWVFSPSIGQQINKAFSVNSDFRVNIDFSSPESQSEIDEFYTQFKCSKKESLQTIFKSVNPERLVSTFPVLKPFNYNMQLGVSHGPIYIYGHYLKLARNISQTPWNIDGDNEITDSVQDAISRVLTNTFQGSAGILHSSGREDIDVRMLGTGRPFILEITEPKAAISASTQIGEIEKQINSTSEFVKVLGLCRVGREKFEELRQGEENKLKVYACVVWSELEITSEVLDKINSSSALVLQQKTPIRVMHRRSLKTREKKILKMKAKYINPHYMELRLVSSGGTYIKEFIHSDFGRTIPSLTSLLGCKADILQLDVLGLGWDLAEVEGLLDLEIE